MPVKRGKAKASSKEEQLHCVGYYKTLDNYKELNEQNDNLSIKIKEIYDNNIWNLKDLLITLKDYYKELGVSDIVAWDHNVQYLDYKKSKNAINEISLAKFKQGEYRTLCTEKKANSKITEKTYANRIGFFTKTFEPFNQYCDSDSLQWIIDNNRLLMYEIMSYHNREKNTISSLSNDFKVMTRTIKLLLGEKDELRYKISALQVALIDLENLQDDLNQVRTKRELQSFVPYEQLLIICQELESQYETAINKLPDLVRTDGSKHCNKLFQLHQVLLAYAMNVWNYPSRTENYSLDIIKSESDALPDKNFLIISDQECTLIYNSEPKDHKPIKYDIRSVAIQGLNTKLCNLLRYSFKTYPRPHLFIKSNYWSQMKIEKVATTSVSNWVKNLIPGKNININSFRSAFVSYYFPKFNNQQKNVLKSRMRTSIEIIMRSYLKTYQTPDTLVKVKIEPSNDLIRKVSNGTSRENQLSVIEEDEINDIEPNTVLVPVNAIDHAEIKKDNFQKWYQKDENKRKVLEIQKKPSTYAKRYIRELNNGLLDYSRMNPITIAKYKISKNAKGVYFADE